MMKRVTHLLLFAGAMAVAACGGGGPVAKDAKNVTDLPSVDTVAGGRDGQPSADGAAPANAALGPPAAAPIDAKPAGAIPAALHGRWGMTPGDCTSTMGDTKGLLIIDRHSMRFYESEAIPVANVQASDTSFSADFAFSGEGQNWKKFQALSLNRDRLVRTESSPMASFNYARCR